MSFNHALNLNLHSTVSPDDYVAISSQIIQFNVGDTSHTLTLSIANDGMCETQTESFFVRISLVSSTGSITISPSQTQVFIDEPECGEYTTVVFYLQLLSVGANIFHGYWLMPFKGVKFYMICTY